MGNLQQAAGVLRLVIMWLLLNVFSRYIPQDQLGPLADLLVSLIINGILPVVLLIWSWRANSMVKQIDNVAKMPEVDRVVASHEVANDLLKDNTKVTPQ